MRKQLVKSVEKIIEENVNTSLLLGDIGVFGFRNSLEKFSNRVFNIGILEQSTIGVAAGLSKCGIIPIVHTIAPFMVERAFEQIKIDFGYQKLKGNFISIGASYDYAALGSTHHCPGDVQLLMTIPNLQIFLPGTSFEFDLLLNEIYQSESPNYFRLTEYENNINIDVKFGKANVIKEGKLATIICVGNMLQSVLDVCQNLDVTILYYTTLKPFDFNTLKDYFNEKIIIVEPYYEGVLNYYVNSTFKNKKFHIDNIGIPHIFLLNYGTKIEHDKNLKLDKQSIEQRIIECIQSNLNV